MTHKFSVKIETGNAAFDPDPLPELARILREVAGWLEQGRMDGACYDINGNRVGFYGMDLTERT